MNNSVFNLRTKSTKLGTSPKNAFAQAKVTTKPEINDMELVKASENFANLRHGSLQDKFLSECVKNEQLVELVLVNEAIQAGEILAFDNWVLLFKSNERLQLIYKTAICLISPVAENQKSPLTNYQLDPKFELLYGNQQALSMHTVGKLGEAKAPYLAKAPQKVQNKSNGQTNDNQKAS